VCEMLGIPRCLNDLLSSVRWLLVTASVVNSSPILVTLMKEALRSSETRLLQEPHGATSQKTLFTVTGVKTSNFTKLYFISVSAIV
jgi:hypothetical protein